MNFVWTKIGFGAFLCAGVVTTSFFMSVQSVSAAKISLQTCLEASEERNALTAQGYETYLDNGPQWSKVHLTPAKLDGVKRLIHLIETLDFRCNTRAMKARRKRANSPAFRRWKALKPPLPRRNPRFVALRNR